MKSYPLPTTEDIFAHLAEDRVLTKLDLSGIFTTTVDEDIKDLTPQRDCLGTTEYLMGYQWHQQYSNQ